MNKNLENPVGIDNAIEDSALSEYLEHIDMAKKYKTRAYSCYQIAKVHEHAANMLIETEIGMAFSSIPIGKSKNSGFVIPWDYQDPFQQINNHDIKNDDTEPMEAKDQISLSKTYAEITKHILFPICCIGGGFAVLVCGIVLSESYYSIVGTCGVIIGIAHLLGFRETN